MEQKFAAISGMLNMNEAVVPENLRSRAIGIGHNMAQVISDLDNRNKI